MASWQSAWNKAKEMGAETVESVINWHWAKGFPSPEVGRAFAAWCDDNGVENRGYSPASPNSSNPNLRKDGVRFR